MLLITGTVVMCGATALNGACSRTEFSGSGGSGSEGNGIGGVLVNGSGGAIEGETGGIGGTGHVIEGPTEPEHHPPVGFEDCVHAQVQADCGGGWCRLPHGCFVLGSAESEWHRGRYTETRVAVTFTHALEVQQMEMSRAEWKEITSVLPSGYRQGDDGACLEDNCPINNITWWEAIHAANLLSEQRELEPCYEPVNCTSELGQGLMCEGVAEPEKSAYECEGYRLPTRSEAEYAARAGTISTWYSGNITVYDNNDCNFDENLDKIGWYCFNSGDRARVRGQKLENGFGLLDMVGNVVEWTSEADRQEGASGGQDPAGFIGTSKDRLAFGGMYNADAWTACRTAGLFAAPWDIRGPQAGFRLYRTLFEDSERSKAIVSEP